MGNGGTSTNIYTSHGATNVIVVQQAPAVAAQMTSSADVQQQPPLQVGGGVVDPSTSPDRRVVFASGTAIGPRQQQQPSIAQTPSTTMDEQAAQVCQAVESHSAAPTESEQVTSTLQQQTEKDNCQDSDERALNV